MHSLEPVAELEAIQSGKTPSSKQWDPLVLPRREKENTFEALRRKEIEEEFELLFKGKLDYDLHRRHSGGRNTSVKFRLKGAQHSGVSVKEALERGARLLQDTAYLMHDFSMDMSGKISVEVRVRLVSSSSFLDPSD